MSNAAQDVLRATCALRDVLSGLSEALETGRLDGVLDAEPALAAAVSSLARTGGRVTRDGFAPDIAAAVRLELERASAALVRCAALGHSLDDVVRARCGADTYDASGHTVAVPVRGAVHERV
jgi:hypothetical protein